METDSFQALLTRVREGDQNAAGELVRSYEQEIRRFVRFRLTDPRLRRFLDSLDICQSIFGNFFHRAAAGEFELNDPAQLRQLLVAMARNKVTDHARRCLSAKRGGRLVRDNELSLAGAADDHPEPTLPVETQDLVEVVRQRLSTEELYLADQRSAGRNWVELGAELNKSPEALRKQLTRALDRVAESLGLRDRRPDSSKPSVLGS